MGVQQAVTLLLQLCVTLVIHNSVLTDGNLNEQKNLVLSAKVYFPQRALEVYEQLIEKAENETQECALNHSRRFEILNKSIDVHWMSCLNSTAKPNIFFLIGCMQVKARADVDALMLDLAELKRCLDDKGSWTTKEDSSSSAARMAEWTKQVAEVKNSLAALRKSNEFYVAVENAKLANHTKCFSEFQPLVGEYSTSIDTVVDNCRKFVPDGHLAEFKQCCQDLTQPILSDIQSKLMYLTTCST